jgi:hypothetical protein
VTVTRIKFQEPASFGEFILDGVFSPSRPAAYCVVALALNVVHWPGLDGNGGDGSNPDGKAW